MTSPTTAELYPRFVSQHSTPTLGITTIVGAIPANVDSNAVQAHVTNDAGTLIINRAATHITTGQYGIVLDPSTETSTQGNYLLTFLYAVATVPNSYTFAFTIGPASPAYDSTLPGFQQIIESVWIRFADLYDSAVGGPYLQTFFQTRFNRDRMAQLLQIAIGRLNTISQPQMNYSINADFPFASWGPLLSQALYVEIIKHLVRSYIEQPEVALSSPISRLDRRDYMQRWQTMLEIESADLELQLETFKIDNMGLGNSGVLISGGAYGNFGPEASMGSYGEAAARGYFPNAYMP